MSVNKKDISTFYIPKNKALFLENFHGGLRLFKVIIICLCGSLTQLTGQTLSQIEVLTTDDGLPFRDVASITQDSLGDMWFGTTQGLINYDGYSFVLFNSDPNNPNFIEKELLTNHNTIYRDQNYIWFAANNSLFKLDTKSGSVTSFNQSDGIKGGVIELHIDYKKQIWIVSENHWTSKDEETYQYLQKYNSFNGFEIIDSLRRGNREFTRLISDRDNNLWWSTYKNGSLQYSEEGNLIKNHELDVFGNKNENQNRGISFFNRKNQHYYFTKDNGINWYNSKKNRWEVILNEPISIAHAIEDNENNIWFAGDNHLYRLDRSGILTNFSKSIQDQLNFTSISQLFVDKNGLLWVSTDNGLIKLRIRPKVFKQLFRSNDKDWGNSMRSVFETKNGDIIAMCERDKKLFVIDKDGIQQNELKLWGDYGTSINPLLGTRFFSLDLNKENAYTVGESLVRIRLRDGHTTIFPEFSNRLNIIGQNPIITLKNGNLLFGFTLSKLTIYNPETQESELVFKNNLEKDILHLRFFLESKTSDNIWIGTLNDGLLKVNLNGSIEEHYHINSDLPLNKNNIMVVHGNKDETLWLGSFGGGLNHLNPKSRKVTIYDKSLGLANNNVVGILPYLDSFLLVSTYDGLSLFNTYEGNFHNFFEEDGLSHNEFNYTSFFIDSQSNYYFGGMNGVNRFKPKDLYSDKQTNSLRFTSLTRYNSKSNNLQVTNFTQTTSNEITIKPYDQYFQINWTSSNYFKNTSNQYLTKLDGYEKEWFSHGTNPFVRYNKLPAGNYVLNVKGLDFSGAESSNYIQIPITVKQIFYKTWWFIVLCILLLFVIIYGLFKFRINQLMALEQLRTKISIDLHDDLGSLLSGIAMQSELLGANAKKEDKSKLIKIARLSRDAISSMRDLVWSIDNRRERVSDLLERMQELAEELLFPKNISFQIVKNDLNFNKKLSITTKQQIFFIYKEAITNILKHSNANNVWVSFVNHDGLGKVIIRDDGSFQKSNKFKGFGLANMSLRAEKMKSTIEFIKEDGFEIHIKLPFKF